MGKNKTGRISRRSNYEPEPCNRPDSSHANHPHGQHRATRRQRRAEESAQIQPSSRSNGKQPANATNPTCSAIAATAFRTGRNQATPTATVRNCRNHHRHHHAPTAMHATANREWPPDHPTSRKENSDHTRERQPEDSAGRNDGNQKQPLLDSLRLLFRGA